MSYRGKTIRSPPQSPRSYVVSIDAGTFANVEIVVGGYRREGVRTPSRTATVKAHSHVYGTPPVFGVNRCFVRDGLIPSSLLPTLHPRTKTRRRQHTHIDTTTIPSISIKRTPLSPLQSRSSPAPVSVSVSTTYSSSDGARSKHTAHEREHAAAQRRVAEECEREQLQRRREAARLAEARRAAAVAAEEEARRWRAEQRQQRERQKQQRQQQALREERRRQERVMRAREIASAWRSYEARWGLLSQRQPELGLLSALTFERIPWPVADMPPLDGDDWTLDELLRPEAIREFLLSPAHSPDASSKDRIRAALRRWHPDKFSRLLAQVMECDREAVAEGMGIVVRCLNEMLEKENHA